MAELERRGAGQEKRRKGTPALKLLILALLGIKNNLHQKFKFFLHRGIGFYEES
jgi:hypothetical protein